MEHEGILLSYSLKDGTGAWSQSKSFPHVETPEPLLSKPTIANQIANQEDYQVELRLRLLPRWQKHRSAIFRGYYPFVSHISRRRKRLSYKAGRM